MSRSSSQCLREPRLIMLSQTGTRRNNNVIRTSTRRRDVVLTWWWRNCGVKCPLRCCRYHAYWWLCTYRCSDVCRCNGDQIQVPFYCMYIRTVVWGVIQWASYQIRKIAGCACAGNAMNIFPRRRLQRKPLVIDPDMHHGTCVPHVPWCMLGTLTRGCGENVPGIPSACAPAILRIW